MNKYRAVLPKPSNASRPFWNACNRGELLIPLCQECNQLFYYPRVACPHCAGNNLGWRRSTGLGKVFSFSHVQMSFFGAVWADEVPYTVILVDLDEGVRLLSRLIGVEREKVAIGARVAVDFHVVDNQGLPFFRLTETVGGNGP